MITLDKTDTTLEIRSRVSKESIIYITISCSVFYIYLLFLQYFLPSDSLFLPSVIKFSPIVFVVLSLYLANTKYKLSIFIDKSKDIIYMNINGKKYHCTISTITKIKTTTNYNYFWREYGTKLLFMQHNGHYLEINKPTLQYWTTGTNVDFYANKNMDVGKAIADYIGVPYEDEFNPKLLPYP